MTIIHAAGPVSLAQTDAVLQALQSLTIDLSQLPLSDIAVEFVSRRRMLELNGGYQEASWGWRPAAQRIVYIDETLNTPQTMYTVLDLFGTFVDTDLLTAASRDKVKALFEPDATDRNWRSGSHRARLSACFADAFARCCSPDDSPVQGVLRDWFDYQVPPERRDAFRAILLDEVGR